MTYYDSMEAAASAMGLDLALLKKIKRKGCKAFKGSRVYPDKLHAYMKSHQEELEGGEESKDKLACRKLRLQCEGIAFDNEVKFKKHVLRSEVDTWQTNKAESLKRLLNTKITNELLPRLQGLMVPEMVAATQPYIKAIVEDFKKPLPKG